MLDVSTEIYKAVRTLCNTILPPGGDGSPTEIILAFQNAHTPKLPYLAISRPSNRQIGRVFARPLVEHTIVGVGDAPDTYTYTQDREVVYEATMTLSEVGGNGNMISTILSYLGDQNIRDLMNDLNISILNISVPTSLPKVQGSGFIDEFYTELTVAFGVVHTITSETISEVVTISNLAHIP